MKEFAIALMVACAQDVSIIEIKKQDDLTDTGIAIVDTETTEPSIEDNGTSPVELDGNVGYVNYYLRQVACPACVGESQELTVEFKAKFFENTTQNHTDWIPPIGTCTDQLLITVPTVVPIDAGQSIAVVGAPNQFVASKLGTEYFANVYESMYDRDTLHTINFQSELDSFEFMSIRGFDTLEPYTMLYVDPSYAFAAPIYKSGMTFSWTPYGSDSNFMITIAVYTQDGTQLLGYFACTAPDQGFMTIPSQYLQNYPVWSLAAIHLARHRVEHVPYQPLGGYVESHMEWEVVGTGHIE